MRTLLFAIALATTGCAGSGAVTTRPPTSSRPDRITPGEAAILKLCVERRTAKEVGAIRVGIIDGPRSWERSFGEVDTPAGAHPANGNTLFEIGSISKTFTALLLADMVQRGEVRLDQPFVELLPAGTALGTPTEAVSVGLGFHLLEAGRLVFHNGQSSMHSFLAVDRSRGLGVVILSDRRGMSVDALGLDILRLLRGDPPKPPPPPRVQLDAAQRGAVVGAYRLAPGMIIHVRDEAEGLTAQVTGQGKNPLVAQSPTMLVIRGTDIRLELVLGASGKAEKLILHQNGKDMPAPREPDGAPPAP